MKEKNKKNKRCKPKGVWARFEGAFRIWGLRSHQATLTFLLKCLLVDWRIWCASILTLGLPPEDTWRVDVGSPWWTYPGKLHLNKHKKMITRIVGDLGFEPRSCRWLHAHVYHSAIAFQLLIIYKIMIIKENTLTTRKNKMRENWFKLANGRTTACRLLPRKPVHVTSGFGSAAECVSSL